MNRNIFLVIIGALISMGGASWYFFFSSEEQVIYDIDRVFTYQYEVKNTTNKAVKDVAVTLPAPVANKENQILTDISSSHEYTLNTDSINNQLLSYHFEVLGPYETKLISIRVSMQMATVPNQALEQPPAELLQEAPLIELAHPGIQKLAKSLAGKSQQGTLRNIYRYVKENLKYSGFVRVDKGAQYAYENKTGDCTEYAHLVTALTRASNIPARVVDGYVYNANTKIKPEDYHSWSEVYFDGRWRLIDALYEKFMEESETYLSTRIRFSESESTATDVLDKSVLEAGIRVLMK